MAAALHRSMTYADLVKLPPDLHRHEILEGEWYMTPAPSPVHQTVVGNLFSILRAWIRRRGLGHIMVAPVDIYFSRRCVLEPDLVFVSRPRLSSIRKRFVQGPPDLVIEVTSPSTAHIDRGRKLEIYRKRGVPEYWIVDPAEQVIEIHEFLRPARTRFYKAAQAFESARLPGLKVRVDRVFEGMESEG